MRRFQLMTALAVVLLFSLSAQTSQAGPYFGIRIGIPLYVGPYPYYGYGYPYPYPYYYPAPVVYQAPPAVVVRSGPYIEAAPAAAPTPNPPPPPVVVPTQNVAPAPVTAQASALLAQLGDPNANVRRDAALNLGRQKAQAAIDPVTNLLQKDPSPQVRDAAARRSGLIASSRSLKALIYAAQADDDRDVRHSAQFAVEVIRTNLRGN